jgi:hypothetical protein
LRLPGSRATVRWVRRKIYSHFTGRAMGGRSLSLPPTLVPGGNRFFGAGITSFLGRVATWCPGRLPVASHTDNVAYGWRLSRGPSRQHRCPRPWRPKGRVFFSDSGQGREQRNVRTMAVPAPPSLQPGGITGRQLVGYVRSPPLPLQENEPSPPLLRCLSRAALDRPPPPLVWACGKGPEPLEPRIR